jgi:hypothetical protein
MKLKYNFAGHYIESLNLTIWNFNLILQLPPMLPLHSYIIPLETNSSLAFLQIFFPNFYIYVRNIILHIMNERQQTVV